MNKVKVIVPTSGGKDSQACLKIALEHYEKSEVLGLFCDTKFEHPITYNHIDWMQERYGVEIRRIGVGDVISCCEKAKRFPGGGSRHCTDTLKIQPTKLFLSEISKSIKGVEVWYGMRSSESQERRKRYADKVSTDLYMPHEVFPSKYPQYLGRRGVRFRMPILEWSEGEVIDYVGGDINPLYGHGFSRVGCFPCLMGGDLDKERAFAFDEFGKSQYIKVLEVAVKIKKDIWTSKSGAQRNNPDQICMFCKSE